MFCATPGALLKMILQSLLVRRGELTVNVRREHLPATPAKAQLRKPSDSAHH
jgi:hypothetical protein